jgi:PHP family Zn ribbon phosphoesterase
VGVLHRVEALADRADGYTAPGRPAHRHLIPLEEVIAESLGQGVATVRVRDEYLKLVQRFGGEFSVLMDTPLEELERATQGRIVDGIRRMREGRVYIEPGYDGEFGRIHLFEDSPPKACETGEPHTAQISLF